MRYKNEHESVYKWWDIHYQPRLLSLIFPWSISQYGALVLLMPMPSCFFWRVHDTHDICYWFLCLITSNPVSFWAEDAGFRVYGTRGCSKPDAVDAPAYPNTSTPNVSSYFFMQRMFVTLLLCWDILLYYCNYSMMGNRYQPDVYNRSPFRIL